MGRRQVTLRPFRFIAAALMFLSGSLHALAQDNPLDCSKCVPLSAKQLHHAIAKVRDIGSVEVFYFDPPEMPVQRPNSSVENGFRCVFSSRETVRKLIKNISSLRIKSADWDNIEPVVEFRFLRHGQPVLTALFPDGRAADNEGNLIVPGIIDGKIAVFYAHPAMDLVEFARDKVQSLKFSQPCRD